MLKSLFNLFAGAGLTLLIKQICEWSKRKRGILLEELTWQQAESILSSDTVIVIPMGAQLKEHGPHLRLDNDFQLAEYLKSQVMLKVSAVFVPTVNYGFYPAFVEYPGSTTLRMETSRDMIVDICSSLARFGPRRFYVLNTGVSTLKPLKAAAEILGNMGILLTFTNLATALQKVEALVSKQQGGSHADEIETSMMLHINSALVQMHKAESDYRENASGPLTRVDAPGACYSPSGIWGDARLATKTKGEFVVKELIDAIVRDIEQTMKAAPPKKKESDV